MVGRTHEFWLRRAITPLDMRIKTRILQKADISTSYFKFSLGIKSHMETTQYLIEGVFEHYTFDD